MIVNNNIEPINTDNQSQQTGWDGKNDGKLFSNVTNKINPVVGKALDAWMYFGNKSDAQEQRKYDYAQSNLAAAAAHSRSSQLMKEAEKYNSQQNQVSQLKQSGLSPAVMYAGGLQSSVSSPSGAQSGSVPPAAYDLTRPDFDATSQLLQAGQINEANIDNIRQNTAVQNADEHYKRLQNSNLPYRQILENGQILADIQEKLSKKNLNAAEKQNLEYLQESIKKQNEALTRQADANTNYISGALTESAKASAARDNSVVSVNEAESVLKKAQTKTETTIQDLNIEKAISEISLRRLQNSQSRLNRVNIDKLKLDYKLTNDQFKMIQDFAKEHDLPKGSEKTLILALDDFSKALGKDIPDLATDVISKFLDPNTWLDFFNDYRRTDKWTKPENGTEPAPPSDFGKSPGSSLPQTRTWKPEQLEVIQKGRKAYDQLNYRNKSLAVEYAKTHDEWQSASYTLRLLESQKAHDKDYSNKR